MKNIKTKKAVKKTRKPLVKASAKPNLKTKVAFKSPHKQALLHIRKNRPLHKRIVLHPITVFILLCSIVYLGNWTFSVAADSLVVTAKVSAPALSQAATITTPLDGTTVVTATITVIGTCPNNSYVILRRNNIMSGVGLCTPGNSYAIDTSLYPGANMLEVQDYNITDDAGPLTPPITVTYIPPIPPIPTPSPSPSPTPPAQTNTTPSPATTNSPAPPSVPVSTSVSANLPTLTTNFVYQAFSVNKTAAWHIERIGGVAPFQLVITWSDGTTTTQTHSTEQTFTISHRYSKVGYYPIKLRISDAQGQQALLQIIAIIKPPTSNGTTVASISNGTSSSLFNSARFISAKHWLTLAWGSIFIVGMMITSFWLGEHQRAIVMQASHRAIRTYRIHKRK